MNQLKTIYDIKLDIHRRYSFKRLFAKEYDAKTRFIHATLCDNGVPINLNDTMKIRIRGVKPNRDSFLYDCNIIDGANGIVEVDLTNVLNCAGRISADIAIYQLIDGNSSIISTSSFEIFSEEVAYDEDSIVSSEHFGALTDALVRVEDKLIETNDAINDITKTKNDISTRFNEMIDEHDELFDKTMDLVNNTLKAEEFANISKRYAIGLENEGVNDNAKYYYEQTKAHIDHLDNFEFEDYKQKEDGSVATIPKFKEALDQIQTQSPIENLISSIKACLMDVLNKSHYNELKKEIESKSFQLTSKKNDINIDDSTLSPDIYSISSDCGDDGTPLTKGTLPFNDGVLLIIQKSNHERIQLAISTTSSPIQLATRTWDSSRTPEWSQWYYYLNQKTPIEDKELRRKRYGIRIQLNDSNPETRVSYILDAEGMEPAYMDYATGAFHYGDWENVWFVKKNRPVFVDYNGVVQYELAHRNHNLKIDGTSANNENFSLEGNFMSEIPLIWVKRYTEDVYQYIIFCQEQYDETYKAYAHTDALGNILHAIYFPMYECSFDGNRLRSISNALPMCSKNYANENDAIHANGDSWDRLSYSDCNLMNEMCIMISKSTNSQDKFGMGSCKGENVLKTGLLNEKGQFFGSNNKNESVKMFYCENFYGNVLKRISGLVFNQSYLIKPTPPYNENGTDYINTNITPATNIGFTSVALMIEDIGRIPYQNSVGGSENKFECDGCYFDFNNTGTGVACYGGFYYLDTMSGLMYFDMSKDGTVEAIEVSTSMTCKPSIT